MKINTDIMKKVFYIILAGIFVFFILIISCPEIFNGKEEDEINFNEIVKEIEPSYTNWFKNNYMYSLRRSLYDADNEEDAAIEELYNYIDISDDGSYIKYRYDKGFSGDVVYYMTLASALQIMRLINTELELYSLIDKIEKTKIADASKANYENDSRQTYENNDVIITWLFAVGGGLTPNIIEFTYQRK